MAVYHEFVFYYDEDTRILVRVPEDPQEAITLFNDDDLSEVPTPPEGSALRNALICEIGLRNITGSWS